MRHINSKEDWAYEFRPYIIIGFGFVGVMAAFANSGASMFTLALVSSFFLFFSGHKIISWRKEYRRNMFL